MRSGGWTSAHATRLYFPRISDGAELPIGINLNTIEPNAAKDVWRSKLFNQLGVRHLNTAEVYRLIVDQHRDYGKVYGSWDLDCLLAHAWFLFTSPIRPNGYDARPLRVASQNSRVLHTGQELYMDSPESGFSISKYFGAQTTIVHYIHERYLTYAEGVNKARATEFNKWLQDQLGVKTTLRLADMGEISREFQYIIDTRPGNEWMRLLKVQWHQYAKDLSITGRLQDVLSKAKVQCTDGQFRQLRDVYLPTGTILSEPLCKGRVPMLAVEDPSDEAWLKFASIGLMIRPDVRFYLDILRGLRAAPHASYTGKDVQRVYDAISRLFEKGKKLVRYVQRRMFDSVVTDLSSDAFTKENLIYADILGTRRWLKMSECRWSCPDCMRETIELSKRYASLEDFFVKQLGLKSATAMDVARELSLLSGRVDRIKPIKELLMYINSCIGNAKIWDDQIPKMLGDKKILPVKNITRTLRSCREEDWFIADREKLSSLFQDKVLLLDFSCQEVQKLAPLFEKLILRRFLSDRCKERYEFGGNPILHTELTGRLQSKAFHISW